MSQVVQLPVTNQVAKRIDKTRYLGLAESNQLLRKALKAAFPGVKFGVKGKSYSGGSSTTITWTDGPTSDQVDKIAQPFGNKGFDGSIDMGYYYDQWLLPNGLIITAGTSGTAGSLGYVEGFTTEKPEGAELVSSGIGYVFTYRKVSTEFTAAVKAAYLKADGQTQSDLLNSLRGPRNFDFNDDDGIAKALARNIAAPAG